MAWEFYLLDWISTHLHSDFLTAAFRVITSLGNAGIFWILLGLVLLCIPKTRRCGLSMILALLCCLVFGNLILKPLIHRIRPYDVNSAVQLLIPRLSDFSFPSGHTYASFAGAVVILRYYKKWGIAALILAVLIAFSRLYFYVHFPTDVLAGMVLGIGFGLLSVWCVNRHLASRLRFLHIQ